jgi:hypothetical protein
MHWPERQTGGGRLPLDQFAADGMHRDPICIFVERCKKTDELIFAVVAKDMQAPGTVFAATPGQENSLPS